MRLGDLDNLPIKKVAKDNKDDYECGWNAALKMLEPIRGIDPETLPIVRQLREELEQAKSERDAAFELIGWIYYEACVSVEHDMRQHIDWLKDKIEEWKKRRSDIQ